ncbi:acetylcholinesterase-like isoform X2 [Pomacea canaliculata]|uniref:acetylcholinesterase-like isoform X2 n=1 Tax=Pomacea canaliculata TaxID=400727 RepID=UPI000D736381|nr:acetylcholinesterase-like isoform X2 [Pomacea canaliculata]
MSGSASSPWARVSPAMALETTRILASRLGCPSFAKLPTSALVSCLRNKPVAELTVHSEVMWDDTARALVDYAWVPVRDGEIVVDVETASSFQGPLLAGLVNNEGGTMQSWERSFLHHNLIPALLRQAYNVSTSTAALVVECFYSSLPEAVAASTRLRHDEVSDWEMSEIFGDVAYVYGTLKDLNRFSSTQASFLYYFDHQTNRRRVRGIRHVDDLAYLTGFVQPLAYTLDFRGNISEEDLQLSRHFRQLIVNFVKNGEPNTGGRPPSWPVWSPYTIRNGDYLVIGRSPRVAPHLKSDRMNFWTYDLPPLLTPSRNVSAKWRECLSSTMRTSGQQPTDSGTLRYWLLSACLCFTLAVLNR